MHHTLAHDAIAKAEIWRPISYPYFKLPQPRRVRAEPRHHGGQSSSICYRGLALAGSRSGSRMEVAPSDIPSGSSTRQSQRHKSSQKRKQKRRKRSPVGVFAAAPTPVSATNTMSETLFGATPVAILLQRKKFISVSALHQGPKAETSRRWCRGFRVVCPDVVA